jgi:hypothetical protein
VQSYVDQKKLLVPGLGKLYEMLAPLSFEDKSSRSRGL